MAKNVWRKELDNSLNSYVEELVKKTKRYDSAISLADDKAKAQIWVALALLSQKLHTIELLLTKSDKKLSKEELKKIMKALEQL